MSRLAPPSVVRRLLASRLGSGPVGRSVLGDLDEEYALRASAGRRAARWWYRREAGSVWFRAGAITVGDTFERRHRALFHQSGRFNAATDYW